MAEIRRWEREKADYAQGTQAELIAAGAAERAWFPKKLELLWTKDGKPYMSNTGRAQRVRRTYPVEGRKPRTILSCRPWLEGKLLWTIEVAVNDKERERREAAERARWAAVRENAERHRDDGAGVRHPTPVSPMPPSEAVRHRALLEEANLHPIALRFAGVVGLFARAESELSAKLDAIRGAHKYSNDYCDAEQLEDIRESMSECADSAKLGRAIEDMEGIRRGLAGIIVELKRLSGAP